MQCQTSIVVNSDHAYIVDVHDCSGFIMVYWNIGEAVDGFKEHAQIYSISL